MNKEHSAYEVKAPFTQIYIYILSYHNEIEFGLFYLLKGKSSPVVFYFCYFLFSTVFF